MKTRHILLVVALVVGLWLANLIVITTVFSDPARQGSFGDMFGSVNALFSGLAFAGVIAALVLQKKELGLQREELRHSREELQGQRVQLEDQSRSLKQQTFDNTFFQLLRLHEEIIDEFRVEIVSDEETRVLTGRNAFRFYYDSLCHDYELRATSTPESAPLEVIEFAYLEFYEYHQADIGHYFRQLYNIVKFVHRSDTPDRRLYTNLIRAQLSSYELLPIFYNCLSSFGSEKFKPLVEEYALLKTLSRAKLFDPAHADFFDASTFA